MNINNFVSEPWDADAIVDKLTCEYDEKLMPLPNIEFQPHLLVSKVRKHYFEYIIKLLSVNYENNQKLLNKNIYLPSAIWRCAKDMEMSAAQTCMMVHIYRKNMIQMVKQLKSDTKKGKLYRSLYECLHCPPENEKRTQTTETMPNECTCQCNCGQKKRRRVSSKTSDKQQFKTDMNANQPNLLPVIHNIPNHNTLTKNLNENPQPLPVPNTIQNNFPPPNASVRMSIESQESDELMQQLEKLFQGDPNDDDLFDGALYDTSEFSIFDENTKKAPDTELPDTQFLPSQDIVNESHAAQIKSLDERLATLTGLLVNTEPPPVVEIQQKPEASKEKKTHGKWMCEEYFLKLRLYEMLDMIRERDRKKIARIKDVFLDLFGDDSDDEGVMSPLDETTEFILSCKERIAPWVVKLLTPYYIKGRIRGKALFKSVAKHLIRLIYQCSKYPSEHEVNSFVGDFLENHKMIRCEADYKKFRIDNI